MENIAEIKTINLDNILKLRSEWDTLLQKLIDDKLLPDHKHRPTYFSIQIDSLTEYFKNLIIKIQFELGLDLSDVRIIYHDFYKYPATKNSTIIHKDGPRKSTITVPIYAKDPVIFYHDDQSKAERTKLFQKPKLVYYYDYMNPVLLNVQNFHAWFTLDEKEPRVLLQLNLQERFENIVARNINKLVVK
jgi:hypothetical protein